MELHEDLGIILVYGFCQLLKGFHMGLLVAVHLSLVGYASTLRRGNRTVAGLDQADPSLGTLGVVSNLAGTALAAVNSQGITHGGHDDTVRNGATVDFDGLKDMRIKLVCHIISF